MKNTSFIKTIYSALLISLISTPFAISLVNAQVTDPGPIKVGDVKLDPINAPSIRTKGQILGDEVGTGIKTGVQAGFQGAQQGIVDSVAQATQNSAGGGVIGSCASTVLSTAAISATIAALTTVSSVVGVPSFNPDTGLAGAFTSGTAFKNFLTVNCLDPAARAIYNKMLFRMNNSILKASTSVNRGGLLNGSTFVSDVGEYFNAVADEQIGIYVNGLDKNNPFTRYNTRQLINEARNRSNGYTPDLAESILESACRTYRKDQAKEQKKLKKSKNNSQLPESNKGFTPTQNIFPNSPSVFKNLITPTIASAQSIVPFSDDLEGSPSVTPFPNIDPSTQNPCFRRADTAEQKQAIIDEYNAGKFKISGDRWLTTFVASTNSKNIAPLAAISAREARNDAVNQKIYQEQALLSYGNGNIGGRVCLEYDTNQAFPGYKGPCKREQIVTPGSQITSDVNGARRTSTEILQKLASTGTWRDLAQTVVTNLILNFSNQLINSPKGIQSFNPKSSNNSQEPFTRSLVELDKSDSTTVAEVQGASNTTSAYVSVVKSEVTSLKELITKVETMQNVCKQILSSYAGTPAGKNHECNIDPFSLDYKDDFTAGARLSNNPIYTEITGLPSLKQQLAQSEQVAQNASGVMKSLTTASSEYSSSQDVDREILLSTNTALLLDQVPQDIDINQKRAQLSELKNRITRIDTILTRLNQELQRLKEATI